MKMRESQLWVLNQIVLQILAVCRKHERIWRCDLSAELERYDLATCGIDDLARRVGVDRIHRSQFRGTSCAYLEGLRKDTKTPR
jgi:hypothetical protein